MTPKAPRLDFVCEKKEAVFHDPRDAFALARYETEVRRDPLTGDTARICHFTMKKAPLFDDAPFKQPPEAGCPFCPGMVETVTPKFEEDIVPGGRIKRGGAVLFPNLFPYDDWSGVIALCPDHYLPMADIPKRVIADAFGAAIAFFSGRDRIKARDGLDRTGVVFWNHLPPSGGSQPHPHMHAELTASPPTGVERLLKAEESWYTAHGRPYFADLLDHERAAGERWIGQSGDVVFLAPFAPRGLMGDCQIVFPEKRVVTDLSEKDVADFAAGLRRVLKTFAARDLRCFNLAFLPAPFDTDAPHHWLTARLIPRFFVNPQIHVSDIAVIRTVLDEAVAVIYPEDNARLHRAAWEGEGLD